MAGKIFIYCSLFAISQCMQPVSTMMADYNNSSRIKRALIICDMQPDILPSLFANSPSQREAFLHAVQSAVLAAISSPLPIDNSLVLFTGLQFPPRYEGLHPNHCLYGSLRRLNEKVGDDAAHWFMEGYCGSDIDASLLALLKKNEKNDNNNDVNDDKYQIIYRKAGHLPPQSLIQKLQQHSSITEVTIIGAKASQSIQSTVQYIVEYCPYIDVSVIREAIGDDTIRRCDAILEYLLPLYARVVSLEEFVVATCGLERFSREMQQHQQLIEANEHVKYYVDCERGGHYSLFVHHLAHGGDDTSSCWQKYPRQKWYEDVMLSGKQYYCPLGKRVVDFCDEPAFSVISMFLKGRDCLDDKGKLMNLAKDFLPETYVIKGGGNNTNNSHDIIDKIQRTESSSGPWFVKETNKNGGRAVTVCQTAEDAMALTCNPKETYVIQRHVTNPSLCNDNGGTKWHLKVYNLLANDADGNHWTLHCHNEPFLCIASKPWSMNDLSTEAQITIRRTKRMKT
eukprot:scaffold21256_cov40-Cyclotella_meneghiniana.AAC.6